MKKLTVIPLFLIFLLCLCSIHSKRQTPTAEAVIPVAYQRLYLSPLISNASLEKLDGWPKDPALQSILLKNMTEIWLRLQSEFRRCEKLGFYEMVDDTRNPSIRISVTLQSAIIANDTLQIPVQLQAERLPDGQKYIYTLQVAGHSKKDEHSIHYLAQLLADYKRNFPYKMLVSFFYPHKMFTP
jgi:hypothetical protein